MEDDSNSEKIDKIIDSELPPLPSSSGVQPENSPDVGTNTSDALVLSLSLGTSQPGLTGQENALTQSVPNIDESITVEEPNSSTGRGEVRARLPPMSSGSGSGIFLSVSNSTSAPGSSGGVLDKGKKRMDSVYPDSCARDYHPSRIPRPRQLGSSSSGAVPYRPPIDTSLALRSTISSSSQLVPGPGPFGRSSGVVWPSPPVDTTYIPCLWYPTLNQLVPIRRLSWVPIRTPSGTRYALEGTPILLRRIFRPLVGSSAPGINPTTTTISRTNNNNPPPFVPPAMITPPRFRNLMPMPTPPPPPPQQQQISSPMNRPLYLNADEAAVSLSLAASTSSTQNENVNEATPPAPGEDRVEDTDLNKTPETEPSD